MNRPDYRRDYEYEEYLRKVSSQRLSALISETLPRVAENLVFTKALLREYKRRYMTGPAHPAWL